MLKRGVCTNYVFSSHPKVSISWRGSERGPTTSPPPRNRKRSFPFGLCLPCTCLSPTTHHAHPNSSKTPRTLIHGIPPPRKLLLSASPNPPSRCTRQHIMDSSLVPHRLDRPRRPAPVPPPLAIVTPASHITWCCKCKGENLLGSVALHWPPLAVAQH